MQEPLNLYFLSVRGNGSRHDPCKAARNILILLGCLNTCEDLLDADADLGATGNLLDFTNGTLLITVRECARLLENVCELSLRVDVRHRDLGIEATKEVELSEHRAFGRGCENKQATILALVS